MLDAVFIRSAGGIRIKGDTTEFIADSFHLKEGATVEELLKKLPGFQVNSRGEITAHGQRVQKVLVDGEEFFGDDPTMATKNISARAVDRVQLYDGKTEQQQLTGISSGNEGKTVNIKLKEEHKKGTFGKAYAGAGTESVTDVKLLYNRFSGTQKISLYGTESKISTGSLDWGERRLLGFENDFEFDEFSGIGFSYSNDDEFENWNLRGLPDSYTAGALFIDKWKQESQSLNASYRYNSLQTTNDGSTLTQTILPDTVFYSNSFTRNGGRNRQHAVNGRYEWKLDSLRSVRVSTVNSIREASSVAHTDAASLNEDQVVVNSSDRTTTREGTRLQTTNVATYKQLFQKAGRQFVGTLRLTGVNSDHDGTLNFRNRFYRDGNLVQSDTSDQFKTNRSASTAYGLKFTYSEPLTPEWNVVAEYSYNGSNSRSRRATFEKSFNGKYDILNPAFSNSFDLDAFSHNAALYGRYATKKLRFAAGTGISALQLDLLNNDNAGRSRYHFVNLTPQLSFGLSPAMYTNFVINYKGNTVQPSMEQLQPLRDNNDPLNEVLGNPDLDVGFTHSLTAIYGNYKALAQRGFWGNASFRLTQNAITNYNAVDSFGKRTYYPVNVDGNYNWSTWMELSLGEGENKWIQSVLLNGNGSRNINFVNGIRNRTNAATIDVGYGLRYEKEEQYIIYLKPHVGWNHSVSSVRSNTGSSFFTLGGNVEGSVMLMKKLELESELNASFRQKTGAFGNALNYVAWNASLSYKFLKKDAAKLSVEANDLLNQNQGVDR
ncbi:MAG TPA: outer membrane beta-barrel protein, partial [Flavisolibacter sp.]